MKPPYKALVGSFARGRWWVHPQIFSARMVIDAIALSILPARYTPRRLVYWVVDYGLLRLEMLSADTTALPFQWPAGAGYQPLYQPVATPPNAGWRGHIWFPWPLRLLLWVLPPALLPIIEVHLVEQLQAFDPEK